jgi:hypothetical protein
MKGARKSAGLRRFHHAGRDGGPVPARRRLEARRRVFDAAAEKLEESLRIRSPI